jgi:hypothetical protein
MYKQKKESLNMAEELREINLTLKAILEKLNEIQRFLVKRFD